MATLGEQNARHKIRARRYESSGSLDCGAICLLDGIWAYDRAVGAKSIELRPWTRNNFKDVMVLLHISSNTSFDCFFSQMDFSPEKAPKFSIVGAAILSEIRKYEDAELFERDRRSHCWIGNETYDQVVEQYGIHPYGHVMIKPILFDRPILDVPGDRGYWIPNPKKPQFDRQKKAFKKAIKLLEKQYQLAA